MQRPFTLIKPRLHSAPLRRFQRSGKQGSYYSTHVRARTLHLLSTAYLLNQRPSLAFVFDIVHLVSVSFVLDLKL